MEAYLKETFVKAVFVDVSQLTKLTVYYRSLQAILPTHSVLSPVLRMCARKVSYTTNLIETRFGAIFVKKISHH